MNKHNFSQQAALVVSAVVLSQSLTACGSSTSSTSHLPPIDESTRSGTSRASAPARPGMSNGQKVAMLAGAAALYYMYKKNQAARVNGNTAEPQYYLSKNGRVYYREAGGRVHWVTAPREGIAVPMGEAEQYSQFEGYDGRTTGRNLLGLGSD